MIKHIFSLSGNGFSDFIKMAAAAEPVGTGSGAPVAAELGDGSADYVEEDLNKTIVKVRPNDTPLDTMTRELGNVRNVSSFEAGGWEMGVRSSSDKVSQSYTTSGQTSATIKVDNPDIWLVSDTISIKNGISSGKDLGLLVVDKTADGVVVKPLNAETVPTINAETVIYRLSSAMAEKDAQAAPYNMVPATRKNFCQIHMCQVEETIIHSLQKKKVALDFMFYKENTLWDMKSRMEVSNFFGDKGQTTNKNNEIVFSADGVWNQIPGMTTYTKGTAFTNADYVRICREVFEGNNGSERRFFFVGGDLQAALMEVPAYQKQIEAKNTEVVLGVRVTKIETSFGELLIKPACEIFKTKDHTFDGVVLDMNHVVKYVREPLQTTQLNLDTTGQRRANAVRMLEDYCLYLENLPVHRKIVGI